MTIWKAMGCSVRVYEEGGRGREGGDINSNLYSVPENLFTEGSSMHEKRLAVLM